MNTLLLERSDASGPRGGIASAVDAVDRRPVICYPMAGDSLGGSHHSLLGLLRGIDQRKYRLLIVVERPNGRLARHFAGFTTLSDPAPPRRSFVPGHRFGLGELVRTFAGIRARARFLRQHGVSIVHTNDGRTHATWALAARLASARLLWHHRGDPTARGLRYLAPLVADKVVTVSRFSLPRGSSRVARNAEVVFSPFATDITVDRAAMRGRLDSELALPPGAFVCGYFGSFIDRKRPLVFIDAIAELRSTLSGPVYGLMFGEAEEPAAEAMIRQHITARGLADEVFLMGYRSPGAEWIAGCDVLLVPAVGEPLGRTLVEAMLVGTPVVATRSGGTPEAIVEGNGWLVTPDDPGALAEACRTVALNRAEARVIAENAAADARSRFGADRHVAAITRIYEQLLGRA